jgi:uncharacterized protein (DUF983 family)
VPDTSRPRSDDAPGPAPAGETAPEFTVQRLGTLVGRALRLRCPNCGGRPVRSSWMKRLAGCPTCGLRLDRGEHDYFIGAYLLNLIVAEMLLGAGLLGVLIATWPDPPWTAIQYGGVALMLLAPLVTYPFTELLWLAFDLVFRPLTAAELQWHREGSTDARELRHR